MARSPSPFACGEVLDVFHDRDVLDADRAARPTAPTTGDLPAASAHRERVADDRLLAQQRQGGRKSGLASQIRQYCSGSP